MEMKTYLHDGLICTSIRIYNRGNNKAIDNIAIDTGAVESILSSSIVKEMGIKYF